MSDYAKAIRQKFTLIGKLIVSKDRFVFKTHYRKSSGQINRKQFIELGDVVYSMFVDGVLVKFGKAAGDTGFYSRVVEYCKVRSKMDKTTQKIFNWMIENGETEIEIYAIKSPRIECTIVSPITLTPFTKMVETAQELEQTLIQEAYQYGEDLILCNEVLK